MKFVFFGTDNFSVTVLDELKKAGFLPALVVTTPDRPKGRGLVLSPSPAKEWAITNGTPFLQPERLDSDLAKKLPATSYQLFIVASYGKILPAWLLAVPRCGTLNVHPSLLPKYRGAAPIENQIRNEEEEIGVTIMLMDEKVDHGPIVARRALQFPNPKHQIPNDIKNSKIQKASELRQWLAEEGGQLLAETMLKWVAGEIKAVPQDENKTTYTKKLTKADGEIDLANDPYQNFLKIRAFEDSIGTYCYTEQTRNKNTEPKRRIRVVIKEAKFKDGKLILTRVTPEGKKEMSYEEFLLGLK